MPDTVAAGAWSFGAVQTVSCVIRLILPQLSLSNLDTQARALSSPFLLSFR